MNTFTIEQALKNIKELYENAILSNGEAGALSIIRSSKIINQIHEAVKHEFVKNGISKDNIFPHIGNNKSELNLSGLRFPKKQDVCVIPENIEEKPQFMSWDVDAFGEEFTSKTIAVNIRSQLSSVVKNTSSMFDNAIANSSNLHSRCKEMVLGEVFMIPVYEYSNKGAKNKKVEFKKSHVNIDKYITFFSSINGRADIENQSLFNRYERCTLLVVDFRPDTPVLYKTTAELVKSGLVPDDFDKELGTLSFSTFAKDICDIYEKRFPNEFMLKEEKYVQNAFGFNL